jgi:hypothetical protein
LPEGHLLLNYVWEKRAAIADGFKVFVHFGDPKEGGKYLFGQDHYIMNGLMDMTKPGEKIIKETYLIKIPKRALNKRLSVHIGLYSPVTGVRVKPTNRKTADNRVYLEEI